MMTEANHYFLKIINDSGPMTKEKHKYDSKQMSDSAFRAYVFTKIGD